MAEMEQREFYRRLRYGLGIGDSLTYQGITVEREEHRVIVTCGSAQAVVQVQRYASAVKRVESAVVALLAAPRKRCPGCDQRLPLDSFYNNRAKADGKADYCKACQNAATYRWRAENRQYHNDGRALYWRNRRREAKALGKDRP